MERIKWYRIEADKQAMKTLQERSDAKGLLQAGSQLLAVVATGGLCFWAFHHLAWPWIVVAFFLHGTLFAFLSPAAACHELSHGTPFKTKALNEFFYHLFSFLTWNNPVWFRISHTEHHQNTLHDAVDQEVVLPARFGAMEWIKAFTFNVPGAPRGLWVHNILPWYIKHSLGIMTSEWDRRLFDDRPKKKQELVVWARIILFGHLALAALFIALGQWILIPILLLPFYGCWLSLVVGIPQHAGLQDNVPDFRRSCRTVKQDGFTRWCYWNMNYHIEHHMYAAIPFHNLPKLHEMLKHDMPVPCKNLAAAWKEINATLKRQKTDPEFYFDSFTRS
ncbi:hypothetical protein PDESU_02741 [Pontiella desulfatans]|uniref:Fatty acid desaturase domain-containing protein n=2 Tax=Pontiella desulfatans TaxID=2750659 RepID=A0A6C2U2G8_PONDE|nr:hypothetical protein PDESU_02741 [Pontiella desulfatans]